VGRGRGIEGDDPTAQKVSADAIAVHKKFDAITARAATPASQAMIDAKHPSFRSAARPRTGSQVLRQVIGPFEVRVSRNRAGTGGGGDEGRAGRA
jgi:hypothetical protein